MIYRTENGEYVISSRQIWLPGVYASERAARYAFRFTNKQLYDLWWGGRDVKSALTFEEMQAYRRRSERPAVCEGSNQDGET